MAKKRQQSKRKRGRPRVTFYGSQIYCRMSKDEKYLVFAASRAFDKRTGMVRVDGKIRSVNDWVREILIREAEKELARLARNPELLK